MHAVLVWVFICLAGAAGAQGLSEAVLKRVQADPEPFLDLAADLIHGFGGPEGIDDAGVGRFVALERAEVRASALRRLAVADLDFDGRVTADEQAVLAGAASAKARGRLWAMFETADGNADRVVSAEEAAAFGRAEAMRAFGPTDEAVARAVLTFDSNADGFVTLEEVKAAVAALAT
jgi:hypothetical protein